MLSHLPVICPASAPQAEDFILPSKRPAYVMADPNTIEINDEKVASTIDISDEYGHVVGTIQGHRFRF